MMNLISNKKYIYREHMLKLKKKFDIWTFFLLFEEEEINKK